MGLKIFKVVSNQDIQQKILSGHLFLSLSFEILNWKKKKKKEENPSKSSIIWRGLRELCYPKET